MIEFLLSLDNPSAKIVLDVSKTQDSEMGDGTTSVAVLCAESLREPEKLVHQRIPSQMIIRGRTKAIIVARSDLDRCSKG